MFPASATSSQLRRRRSLSLSLSLLPALVPLPPFSFPLSSSLPLSLSPTANPSPKSALPALYPPNLPLSPQVSLPISLSLPFSMSLPPLWQHRGNGGGGDVGGCRKKWVGAGVGCGVGWRLPEQR
ncbi:hypothetical protein MRB53_021437 [Persea americana]|uniref:Uncharacterized protein n=1 Tax=Persea americana TaxID=3435 RepID=A0ACC2L4D8_PERAE|nr:hypothetical protein MRB53_021437 [Persea americana]